VRYSRLTEDQVPCFVQHFLGAIADVLKNYDQANIFRNTWGDGLYLDYSSVRDAGRFALELRDTINAIDGEAKGLPTSLSLRIALHAGPVFGCTNPITGQRSYTGTQVNRAARLEPQTPPGEVCGSEAFAAFTTLENVMEFSCHCVKQLQWAKHYGTFPPTFFANSESSQLLKQNDGSHHALACRNREFSLCGTSSDIPKNVRSKQSRQTGWDTDANCVIDPTKFDVCERDRQSQQSVFSLPADSSPMVRYPLATSLST
jgi:hypothetical protein